ncbi:hypothetical protein KY310_01170, partial [Candidatus Woesearchaeota archaeon]|nr:hypothetical protein [Candidatus Woesearchaeota archaeon]
IIAIILGLIVIASIGGLLWQQKGYIAEKIFGKEIFPTPPKEGEFVPYEPELTEEEIQITDSMNALTCAINTVSSDKIDLSACQGYAEKREEEAKKEEKPEEKLEEPQVSAPTGSAVAASLAGVWEGEVANFGGVTVDCRESYSLGEDKPYTLEDVGKFVESCAIRSNLADTDTYCGKVFMRKPPEEFVSFTKEQLVDWLKKNADERVKKSINDGDLVITFELPVLINHVNEFHVCADNDATNEIYLYVSQFGYDTDCSDAYFEWSEATKRNYQAKSCIVQGFSLPQKITSEGSWNPVTWIAGYNDPQYIAYYEAFPQGVDKYWHVDGVSIMTVGLIAGTAVFDLVPLVGKAGSKIVSRVMKEGAEETAEQLTKQTIKTGLTGFLKSIAGKGLKRTVQKEVLTEGLENVGVGVSRKLATEVADTADNYVVGFFRSMRARWSDKYRKELVEEMTKKIKQLDLTGQPMDPAFYTSKLDDAARKLGRNPDELFDADSYLKELAEETDEAQKFILEKTLPAPKAQLEQDAILFRKIHQEIQEEYTDQLARDMAEKSVEGFTRKVTKAELKEFSETVAVKSFLKGMFSEGMEKMSQDQIRKNMQEAFKKFSSLSMLERRRAVKKAAELSKKFVDPDGFIDFTKITGKALKDSKAKQQLTEEFMEAITYSEGIAMSDAMRKAGFSAAQGLKEGTVGPGKVSWVLDLAGVPRLWRVGKELTKFPITGLPVYSQAKWMARTGATTVGELAGWVKNHKYAIIAMMALYGSSVDGAQEKFRPVGVNTLGVDMPYIYSDPAPWELIKETQPYYIAPVDQGGNLRHERLYLVSPCKADLIIQKDICECHRVPLGIQHYRFNEDNFEMDVRGVNLDLELLSDDEFVYKTYIEKFDINLDELTEKEKSEWLERKKQSIKTIGLQNPYLYIQNPFLRTLVPDVSKITTLKDAIIAHYRLLIVDFYDQRINGLSMGGYKGLVQETYRVWETYEPFYDLSGVQKECVNRETFEDVIGLAKIAFVGEVSLNENVFAHPAYKADCITVQVQRLPGDDANYCIDEYPYTTTLRYGAFAVQVAASVAISVFTGGIATPLMLAGTSVGMGIAEEVIARQAKWPAYNTQGLSGQVPIAQSTSGG